MSILSNIWNFLVGNSAEKGSVDGASKHPLDTLAGLEEKRVAPVNMIIGVALMTHPR